MSGGFLPDLANWALGGGAGQNNDSPQEEESAAPPSNEPVLSPQEMREQRLARMALLEQKQKKESSEDVQPMEVDETPPKKKVPTTPPVKPATEKKIEKTPEQKKKKAKNDDNRKITRKKEAMLAKTLQIALVGTSTASNTTNTLLDLGSTEISVQSIAEILAMRLSTNDNAKPLIAYLAKAYANTSQEMRSNKEMTDILQEIKSQVVSYAATTLMEPDLFEAGANANAQLEQAIMNGVTDLQESLTLGGTQSFYHALCEELLQQNYLQPVVTSVMQMLRKRLEPCDSVLDGVDGSSPVVIVSAMAAVCSHKKAAALVASMDGFLLPNEGTPEANEVVRSLPNAGAGLMQLLAGGAARSYLKRSGPGLAKYTLLGQALVLGAPKSNGAFTPGSVLRQSPSVVDSIHSSQRQSLTTHQNACYQLVWNLIKAGAASRATVMRWFSDALEVNRTADGLQPDPRKVSAPSLLLNMSVILLKLCDPFVRDTKKHHLIDAGYINSATKLFPRSGDDAVSRLGQNSESMETDYAPENAFVPECFFLCARSLHFGIVPQLTKYESLLRHISHLHWRITNQNGDLHSDPRFSSLISQQRSMEVSIFQEEMVKDVLTFGNFVAKVLYEFDDDALAMMPEDFVSDLCDVLMGVSKLKVRLLSNTEVRYIFKLMVKLLSAKYASMVRNYNLRSMLGDVLYELFIPAGPGERRDVPSSLSVDPLAGGQTYLLSDAAAQETLAPSLLLLYGEVEHTGHYEKMSHRAKIASLIKYLWDSAEHRPAFRRITQDKDSFIKFANGIMNETNTLIATVMQTLPEIRNAQEKMKNTAEWGRLSEDEQGQVTERLSDNEREVKHALSLCNKTLQMFGYLNTDTDIRTLFLLEELCPRLVSMLLHVLTKLVGSKGLDLKVDNPEQYDFRPKEMLRDLCAIFALFATLSDFQVECAKAGCDPNLLRSAVKTCRKLNLLTGESMVAFENLPDLVETATQDVASEEALLVDAPDEFLDPLLSTYMKDPVRLPSNHIVDRSTITQHLLNDPTDPFSRKPMTVDDIVADTELQAKMKAWLDARRAERDGK